MVKSILEKVRKEEMKRDSSVSEIQLRQEHPGVKEKWDKIQALKNEMVAEKQKAIQEIDEKYKTLIETAEKQYAVMIKLVRK